MRGDSALPFKVILVAGFTCLASSDAAAYIGPGSGLTAIGSLLALVAAVLLGIIGFIWYPIKRLRRRIKARKEATVAKASDDEKLQ
jgi:hypothetical protein